MTSASLRGRPEGFTSAAAKPNPWQRAKRVVRYRRILQLLVRRDLKVRYAGSALGYVWSVLDPLLMSLVYYFVLVKIFKRNAGPNNQPFMLYLVTGQLIWAWFSGGVMGTARSLLTQAQMVRSSNVPRELWVVRVVMSKGVEYLLSLPVVALFAIAYLKAPTIGILLLPLAMLFCFTLVLGAGLALAPVVVLVRDIERIIPIIMRVLFYASPVLYSVTQVQKYGSVYEYNPAVGMLLLTRAAFFPADLDWPPILHSAISTLVILGIGVVVFARLERPMLKEI